MGPGQAPLIDADLAAFLESPVMIILGTGAGGVAEIGRGRGARVEADGRTLRILVSAWQWPGTVENARRDGRLAATFARPSDYVTYQVKGLVEGVEALTPALEALTEMYAARVSALLAELGLSPELVMPWGPGREMVALRLRAEAVFVQTPGARAGSPLAGA